MKRNLLITAVLLALLPRVAQAQWTFDIVSVEAYINDHKKQRSLLLARSTLEYSNQLLHEYSRKEVGGYKELNVDLDRYTRAFDVIDVMYQSLRTALNVKSTYTAVSDRIGDYKRLLEDFNEKVVKRGRIDPADALIIKINERAIRDIAHDGEQLYRSVSDLVLYVTGAAACSTSDLLMVLEGVNRSLDDIERHLNRAYIETWRYIQVRIGYWKEKLPYPQHTGDCGRRLRPMARRRPTGLLTDKREKEMKRTWLLTVVALVTASAIHAQSVTYNHDAPKQGQITVMETGTGTLSPELYYWALHNKYRKSAAGKNKLSYRTLAGINLYNQVDEAEAIDSALVSRAKIEALNVADRQIDIAWLAEGDKIDGQMERLKRNIDRILPAGGTPDDKERWTEYYHIYQCAIDATRDAYMPNAQRKKEYLRIYEDVARQNEILVSYLARRQNVTVTSSLLSATDDRRLHKGSIVREAMNRWNESRLAVRSSQSGGGTETGDGEETVSRGK